MTLSALSFCVREIITVIFHSIMSCNSTDNMMVTTTAAWPSKCLSYRVKGGRSFTTPERVCTAGFGQN